MIGSDEKKLIPFGVITWVLSWSLWYVSGVLGREADFVYDKQWLIAQVGVFAPSLSALFVSAFYSRECRKNSIRILLLFVLVFVSGYFIAERKPHSVNEFTTAESAVVVFLGIAVALYFSARNRHLLLPGTGMAPGRARWVYVTASVIGLPLLFVICWLLTGITDRSYSVSSMNGGSWNFIKILLTAFFMNLIFGGSLGEEIGWRGFALPLLLKRFTPLQASFYLGIAWALWHLPIDITGAGMNELQAIVARFAWSLPLSILFTWFYLRSNGNLLIPIFLHTSVNILPDLEFSGYEKALLLFTFILVTLPIILLRSWNAQHAKSDT